MKPKIRYFFILWLLTIVVTLVPGWMGYQKITITAAVTGSAIAIYMIAKLVRNQLDDLRTKERYPAILSYKDEW